MLSHIANFQINKSQNFEVKKNVSRKKKEKDSLDKLKI